VTDLRGEQCGTVPVPEDLWREDMYCAPISGTCMEPDIRDGDLALIDPNAAIADGDIAVVHARLPWGTGRTVKRIYRVPGGGMRLVPRNRAHPVIVLGPEDEPVILGKVFAVLRSPES
jgi:phage repressor protein C with HTH and peptisase S24 domain